MPIITPSPPIESSTPPTLGDRLYRLSLDQYHRLAESGVLEGEPVVLVEGLLVTKMTKKRPRVTATEAIQYHVGRVLPAGWYLTLGNPIALAESDSEPEPDVLLLRGSYIDYQDRAPRPEDVGLIVEASESSLSDDRTVMKRLYAQSAVPIYWIVNLPGRKLEVHTEPSGPSAKPDYRRRIELGGDDEVALTLDGRDVARIPVRDLIPPFVRG